MKTRNRSLIFNLILAFSIGLLTVANATIVKKGQTGVQFLKLDGSARAAAMGSAYMMLGEDASAVFYNPATLGLMKKSYDFMATSTSYIADVSYYHMAIAGQLPANLGNIGLSLITTDYGTIEGTEVAANEDGYIETGDINISAMSFGLTYARQMNNKFTIGGQIKKVHQYLGTNSKTDLFADVAAGDPEIVKKKNKVDGLAFDFGTIFYPGWKSFRFGMSVRNFSSEYDFNEYSEESNEGSFELPLTFAMGTAIDLLDFVDGMDNQSLVLAIDAIHPRDYTERLHVGVEYWFADMLALRGGYKFNYDTEGLTLGFGVKLAGAVIDYSYSNLKYFDALNRFSVGFGL